MFRPRFSLLSLLLLSLACAAGMGVYWRSSPWVVERAIETSSESPVHFAAVSPNGAFILPHISDTHFECRDRNGRKLWGPVEGRPLYARVSPDNRWIFVEGEELNNREVIYELATGKRVQVVPTRRRGDLTISPNGKYVFSNQSNLTCWTVVNGRMLFGSEMRWGTMCFPSQEYLAELKRIQPLSDLNAHAASDLISHYEALNGPRESAVENDIERLSEVLQKLDEPADLTPDDPRLFYDYALGSTARISADGSTLVTQFTVPGTQEFHAALWHADTLQRICRLSLPNGYYVSSLSHNGGRAILLSREGNHMQVVSLPGMEVLHQAEGPQDFEHDDDDTFLTGDGLHLVETFKYQNNTDIRFQTRITHLPSGRTRTNTNEHIERAELTPDCRRFTDSSDSLNDFETGALLFEFKADDAGETPHSIVAILDDDHVLTDSDTSSILIWKRIRPEWWWGHFWRWEVYVCLGFSFAFFWSLFHGSRAALRSKSASSRIAIPVA